MDRGSPGQGRTCRTSLCPCKGKWMWAALLHSPSSAAFIPGEEGWEEKRSLGMRAKWVATEWGLFHFSLNV